MDEFDQKLDIHEESSEEIVEKIPGRDVYETISSLVSALLVVTLVFTFVVRLMGVSGPSMIPTLQDGDRLLVVNSLLCGEYEAGDIVIVRKESFDAQPIVKRVIATEGQEVEIDFENWTVKVDGVLLEEDYINRDVNYDGVNDDRYVWMASPTGERVLRFTVEPGKLFVMGDNRNHSTDSRSSTVGQVDERQVLGRVLLRLFPFSAFGTVE